MEALDNAWYGSWRLLTNLTRTFRAYHLCCHFLGGSSLHMAYYCTPWYRRQRKCWEFNLTGYALMTRCTYPRNETWVHQQASFTSYTTLGPHSSTRRMFTLTWYHTFNMLMYTIIARCTERTTVHGLIICMQHAGIYKTAEGKHCHSRLINWCVAPPLRVKLF